MYISKLVTSSPKFDNRSNTDYSLMDFDWHCSIHVCKFVLWEDMAHQ